MNKTLTLRFLEFFKINIFDVLKRLLQKFKTIIVIYKILNESQFDIV